jgi:hypothetical protein
MPKALVILGAIFVTSVWAAPAQTQHVPERGAHHRVLETVREVQTPGGARLQTNRIVELQGGLHRWTEQGWVEAHPRIEVFQDGAVIRNLQYGAIFAPNLATPNAIDLSLPDEAGRVQGHLIGLALTEGNQSVLVAEVKDCAGVIGGAEQNELTYADAMTDFAVSVKYVAQRDRLSQIVLLEQQLPHPSEWGLTENAVLEVLTEFSAFPELRKEPREAVDGIPGEHLSFASMEFITGKAFSVGDEGNSVLVQKKMELFEGQRWFLVEKVPWRAVAGELAKLPPVAKDWRKRSGPVMARDQLRLPKRQQARAAIKPIRTASEGAQVASAKGNQGDLKSGTRVTRLSSKPAYVLDWELVSSVNSNLWRADTTYYIAGGVTIKTNIFEGGCVIKFAPTNSAKLTITGPVTCKTSAYKPVVFSGRDESSVGQLVTSDELSGGYNANDDLSGGYYANTALELDFNTSGLIYTIDNFRLSHAETAVKINGGYGHALNHVQIVHAGVAASVQNADVSLRNTLAHDVATTFSGSGASSATGRLENVTVTLSTNFNVGGNCTLFLTNTLLVGVTNIGSYSGSNNGESADPTGVFETVGAGSAYLANTNVAWRGTGTTNINSAVLAELRKRSTYPPVILTNRITADTILSPQALRGSNGVTLGYHYPVADFAVSGLAVTNCSLFLTGGVVVATFGDSGIWLQDNSLLVSSGTAPWPNRIARFNAIQEQSLKWGDGSATNMSLSCSNYGNAPPSLRLRFTDFAQMAGAGYHLYLSPSTFTCTSLSMRDCGINSGAATLGGYVTALIGISNNVFNGVTTRFQGYSTLNVYNNLFKSGPVTTDKLHATNLWTVRDNSFDGTTITEINLQLTVVQS